MRVRPLYLNHLRIHSMLTTSCSSTSWEPSWCSVGCWFSITVNFCQSMVVYPGNVHVSVTSPSACLSNRIICLAFFPIFFGSSMIQTVFPVIIVFSFHWFILSFLSSLCFWRVCHDGPNTIMLYMYILTLVGSNGIDMHVFFHTVVCKAPAILAGIFEFTYYYCSSRIEELKNLVCCFVVEF